MPAIAVRPLAATLVALMTVATACSSPAPGGAPRTTPSSTQPSSTPAVTRYIGNTAGQGVRLRVECRDAATVEGSLAEQAEVRVDLAGPARARDGPVSRPARW